MMPFRALLLVLFCILCGWGGEAAKPAAVEALEPHPVIVWNRTIAELRVGIDGLTVAERIERIQRRIAALTDESLAKPTTTRPATIDGVVGQMIFAGPDLLLILTKDDVAPGQDPADAAKEVVGNLRQLFDAQLAQRRPETLLWACVWSGLATIVLIVCLWLILRARRRIHARLEALRLKLPHLAGVDTVPVARGILRLLLGSAFWAVGGLLLYVWLAEVLAQFPYTRPLADALGRHLLDVASVILTAVLGSLPGLGMVLLIFILTRIAGRALDSFFTGVENGAIVIGWMEPDTAKATRRIASIVLWLFAIIVAYPYMPGSSSEAFKGVSVFAGLLLTFGSAGIVNQMMSGLLVVYSRMMKPGDMVKVGEVSGQVTELGFLSTKVRTATGHEVILPNATLTSGSVSNFSRYDKSIGPQVVTAITIGYDTPWRQVHGLLHLAASRTPGLVPEAKPEVLQTALSDFYVEYQLRCRLERVEDRVRVLSDLNAQVLDAFNEFEVQIMSPHFVRQPDAPVLVPVDAQAPPPATIPDPAATGRTPKA